MKMTLKEFWAIAKKRQWKYVGPSWNVGTGHVEDKKHYGIRCADGLCPIAAVTLEVLGIPLWSPEAAGPQLGIHTSLLWDIAHSADSPHAGDLVTEKLGVVADFPTY